ncbi:hypothetical protein LJC48_04455 [Desulfovibrio sp. OttesenSCG-928-C06]|nr:hypothetical protein [Desulfovibrio sp. OttesenSCG-928-C06]
MKKEELLNKLEGLVTGMREELDKHEGSTLQTISASMKSGYDGVKSAISGNEKAQKFLDNMKNNFDELTKTVKAGDQKLSAKTLAALEKLIHEYKEKNAGADEEADKESAEKTDGQPIELPAADSCADEPRKEDKDTGSNQ